MVTGAVSWSHGAGDLPEAAYRMIVDLTANPFTVVSRDGTIRYAGRSIEQVLGWRAEELVGRNIVEFLPPEQVGQALDAIAEIDQTDRAGAGVPMVFEVVCADGTTTWVELGAMPVLDVPGIDGIVVRHRPWEEQRHFDRFLIALLADDPLCEVLDALAQSISASVQAAGATIHHGFDGRSFAAVAGSGVPDACRSLDEGPWSDVVAVGAATYLDVDDLAEPVAAAARSAGFGACWTLPVTLASGLAPAVLTIWRGPSGGPLLGHRRVLERAARHVQLALVRTAEHERLRHLAGHDALTGVANRLQFHDRLARALAIGERDLAVAFCDLDRFKVVNDTWGHRVGDDILVQAAERVRSCLRVGDELARMGGDEFTILLRALPDRATADQVITRLRAAFCEPFRIGGSEADLGLSVGIALARPDSTADSLLSEADAALYQAKHLRAHEPRPS